MRIFFFTVIALFIGNYSFAFKTIEVDSSQVLGSFDQNFSLKNGETVRLHSLYRFNLNGEKELLVNLVESHVLAFDSEQLVLIGRDLNEDGFIDTWFYQKDSESVWTFNQVLVSDQDFANINKVLNVVFDDSGRWIINIVMQSALENLTIAGSDQIEFNGQYEGREIDILDMELRIDHLVKEYPNDPSISSLKKMNNDAWKTLFNDFNKQNGFHRPKMVAADVGLFFLGGLLFKGVGLVGKAFVNKYGINEIISYITKAGEAHYQRLQQRMSVANYTMRPKLLDKFLNETTVGSTIVRILAAELHMRPALLIKDFVMKNRMAKLVYANMAYLVEGLAEIKKEKWYIGFTAATQLGTEAAVRGYLSWSDVPLILEHPINKTKDITSKLASDKAFIQNLGYLTTETTVITGVSKVLKMKGVSLAKRILICGFVSTANSLILNKAVKDEVNLKRIAGDTSWEVVVGNSQVIFDNWQWQQWREMAITTGNKPLILVGVVITFVHQSAGFYLYNKWGEFLDSGNETQNKNSVELVNGEISMPNDIKDGSWKPVLVPVYAPPSATTP
jgi:hypothetical protein